MENSIKENVRSADKKPEIYVGADGKRAVRMVSVDREIVKKEDKKISLAKLQKLGSKGPNIFDKKTSLAKLQKLGSKGPKIFDGVEEGYLGSKGEKGRDKGNAGKFDKNTAYSHAKTHNGVVHKDASGSYLVKHGRGKNVSEETVELDEAAINFRKAHQEIMAYAKKHGDIDKKDFEKVAYYLKAIGDNQNTPNVANRAFVTMKAFVAGMDTDPRDKVYLWFKKYGMIKNGKMVQESSVEKTDEACWDSHKQIGMKKKGDKMVPNCVPKESTKEYGKSLDRIKARRQKDSMKPGEMDKLTRLKNMMKKEEVKLDEISDDSQGRYVRQSFSEFSEALSAKDQASATKRKADREAKRGARRGPQKGTEKSAEGDWTDADQKKAPALDFNIKSSDHHSSIHKTIAKAADASHPKLGGRKVKVQIGNESQVVSHKDLQHIVDYHKKLNDKTKKAALMKGIAKGGHMEMSRLVKQYRKITGVK